MVHHRRVARIGLAALFLFAGCARAEDAGAGAGEPGRGADSDDAQPSPDHEELAKPEFVEPMAEVAAMLETFQSDPFASGRWVKSAKAKYTAQAVAIGQGAKGSAFEGDQALLLKEAAKHYGVVRQMPEPFIMEDEDLVFQYETRFHEGLDCGGAYVKLLHAGEMPAPAELDDTSPYVVMFGPDKCGSTNKVHFILRHQNPVSGEWQEHHLKNPPSFPADTESHMFTLAVRRDNSFSVAVDGKEQRTGSLLEDLEPPVNPPTEIDDPEDEKPMDWVDEAKIPDPDAVKPEDWDESAPAEIVDEEAVKPDGWLDDDPQYVPDPEADMPDDWDEEEDGEWEPPMVLNPKCEEAPGCGEWEPPMKPNPEYKGKWSPPMIDNPAYKGEWKPRKIKNPHFFEDSHPHNMPSIGAVAIEVWTMSGGIAFDNLLLTHDEAEAARVAEASFEKRKAFESLSEREQKRRAARQDRLAALARGGVEGYFTYVTGEAAELASDHPLATVGAVVAVLVAMIVLCVRFTVGEGEGEDEEELLRAAVQQARGEASARGGEGKGEDAPGDGESPGSEGGDEDEGEDKDEDKDKDGDEDARTDEKEVAAEAVRSEDAAAATGAAGRGRRRRRAARAE